MTYSIHLNDLEFFAHHGWHNEEALAGGNYKINLTLDFEDAGKMVNLEDTINYVSVYDVIKIKVNEPVRLLETLAADICEEVSALDKRITTINITITKLHPPISNFIGNVAVSLSKSYPSL